MTNNKVNAIILAGTHKDPSKLIDGQNKAFLKVNNQPVILNILNALQNSKYINQDKIFVIGPKSDLEKIITPNTNSNINILPEAGNIIENIITAYDHPLNNKARTLFLPCELPFIAPETINDFVSQCNKYSANFYFGIINKKNIPQQIEPFKKTKKFHLREKGYYRTANMGLFENSGMEDRKALETQIRNVFENRRASSSLAMIKLAFSLSRFIPETLKYFTPTGLRHVRGLTENEIESAISKKLKTKFKIIETTDPRAVADIDYKADLTFFNKNYQSIKNTLDNQPLSKNI